jgi:hypothetical protein
MKISIYTVPVTLYHRIIEEDSLLYLLTLVKGKQSKIVVKGCIRELWDTLNSQIIDEFGVSTDIELIYYKQNTINKCELEMLKGGENHETLIEILKSEIHHIVTRLEEKTVKDLRKHHARLYRGLEEKYHRDPKKLTVFEFYNDLNDWQKEVQTEQVREKPRKVANG